MKIAQASISENGTIDGLAGNQNGKELNIANFKGKWDYIIRFKDKQLREYVATIVKAGVNNKHIGYSQYKRNSLWRYAKKFKSLGNITINCSCDCSSLVSVVVNLAYYVKYKKWLPNYNIDANACTTQNMVSKLSITGQFEIIPFSSKDDVISGDIVLKEKKHTGIII